MLTHAWTSLNILNACVSSAACISFLSCILILLDKLFRYKLMCFESYVITSMVGITFLSHLHADTLNYSLELAYYCLVTLAVSLLTSLYYGDRTVDGGPGEVVTIQLQRVSEPSASGQVSLYLRTLYCITVSDCMIRKWVFCKLHWKCVSVYSVLWSDHYHISDIDSTFDCLDTIDVSPIVVYLFQFYLYMNNFLFILKLLSITLNKAFYISNTCTTGSKIPFTPDRFCENNFFKLLIG